MVHKTNIKKWVGALRSGTYIQAYETLSTGDNCMCALGVACAVSGQGKWVTGYYNNTVFQVANKEYEDYLPNEVYNWLGIETSNPGLNYDGKRFSITILNDTFKLDFNQIADLIEQQYLM